MRLNLPTIPTPTTYRRPEKPVWFRVSGLPCTPSYTSETLLSEHASLASRVPSRLATTIGRIEFMCISDWSFPFRCSPPRLATTQLRSDTKFKPNFDEDLHLADSIHSEAH